MTNDSTYAVTELVARPTNALAEVPRIAPDELRQILFEWNQTEREFPRNQLIHEPFETQVDTRPHAQAVVCGDRSFSYAELESLSNLVAQRLLGIGVGPGKFVGVCVSRGIGLVAALLGVLKAGAAYVPADLKFPPARINTLFDDARVEVVITERPHLDMLGLRKTILIEDVTSQGGKAARPLRRAEPTDPCYVIYTSGTTGRPNGVLVSHRSVSNVLDWVNRTFEVTSGDRLLFVTSPCFDLSVYDVFGVLAAGGTVVVAREAELKNPQELARLLTGGRISIWDSAPAALGLLCEHFGTQANSQLRLVLLSGDFIPLSLPDVVRKHFPLAHVISLGGATEAAIWSNWFPIERIDPEWTSIPYGVPIQNCWYHVLDPDMRPVPVGTAGELYIGGECLALGYLNQPELTQQRFLPDPFRPGQRLYKTGDRAQYFDTGILKLLGRQDSQVKIRGFRLEIGEVEAALCRLPGVTQAVVTTHAEPSGERSLWAYIVLEPNGELDAQGLRRGLAVTLPSYAVPSQITVLDELPVSSNGKVDRKALPLPHERTSHATYVPPRTAAERDAVAIWQELLGKQPIGVTDDFFALGGHSIVALSVLTRINSRFGTEIALDQLIAHPTIESLLAEASKEPQCLNDYDALLVGANQGAPGVPIVFFPGLFGSIFPLRELPNALGPDRPAYLAQHVVDFGEDTRPFTSIESMAECYEQAIVKLHPRGPVVLSGYSLGMLIGFEVALRLEARGVRVPLLISLEGVAPGYPKFLPLGPRIGAHFREFFFGSTHAYLTDRLENTHRRWLRYWGREHELSPAMLSSTPAMRERLRRVFDMNIKACHAYHPDRTLATNMLLFQSEEPERWVGIESRDPLYGWQRYVKGDISTVSLPGNHGNLLEASNPRRIAWAIRERVQLLDHAARENGHVARDVNAS